MPLVRIILGCGYLGRALLQALSSSPGRIVVTSRSRERLAALTADGRAEGLVFETGALASAQLSKVLAGASAVEVFCLLTPSALSIAPTRERLVAILAEFPLKRAVLVSSTGIYGAVEGGEVSAETVPHLSGAREQGLADIEQAWLRLPQARIVRMAGLYGPERVIGAGMIREGRTIPGRASAWLNLIHQQDAAGLLCTVAASEHAATVELGSDGQPMRRSEYYGFLAELLSAPAPRFESLDDGDAGKRVNPMSTWQRLGWRPRFTSYRDGVRDALGLSPGAQ
jgi:nucleoside-diphosphate-sugar epimerase